MKSLSAKLLVLTILFVMVSEVLIFVPSVARYRLVYLEERIAASHLATLALEVEPGKLSDRELEQQLLRHAGARVVVLRRPETRTLALGADMPPEVDAAFDLRGASAYTLIRDAYLAMAQREDRVIHVVGQAPQDPNIMVDVIFDEAPMRAEMYDYAGRIFNLSIAISLITAGLVFLALQWLLVRPMRRITQGMVEFREAPEDPKSIFAPSARSDEIGTAQRELAAMQDELRAALKQKTHLAVLGTAVSKINHDLRNILATARLVSDRLTTSDDPEVRRITPTLVRAIDRGVALCTNTLRFGRAEEPKPVLTQFALRDLVADVAGALGSTIGNRIVWRNEVDPDVEATADRDQLYRVLLNLGRNSVDAMANQKTGEICIRATREDSMLCIDFMDTGPGMSEAVSTRLFEAFSGAARAGGTGLGLAIARDLIRGHGGDIRLAESGPERTVFRLELPAKKVA